MKPILRMIFVTLFLAAITACSPAAPITQVPAPTEQESSGSVHLMTTKTGIASVDQILAALASGEPQALRDLVEFTDAVCTQQDGLGGPPKCRAGEAEGSPVEVLAFLDSEGYFLRRDEIGNWAGIQAAGLYAVYEVNAAAMTAEQYYPIGNYVILLVNGENQPGVAVRVGESGIVRVDAIFDPSPANLDAMIEREALNVLLPPKS